MSDDRQDALLAKLFAQSFEGPADAGFTRGVSTRIRRDRLTRGAISIAMALICGLLVAWIVAPLIIRMIASGDPLIAIALVGCGLAGLGITVIRAES